MNGFSRLALCAALCGLWTAAQAAPADERAAATLRAGRNIAVTTCIACHVVSDDQTLKPVLGGGIPSFREIAARPGASAEGLEVSMKDKRWHDPGMTQTLLPMSRISDRERGQVAAYIMSLKK